MKKLYAFFCWLMDFTFIVLLITVLYAAFNSQACLKIWEYQYGVCPDFGDK